MKDHEIDAKKKRKYNETICRSIDFHELDVLGIFNENEIQPLKLTVNLVPSSFKRLRHACLLADTHDTSTECRLRKEDMVIDQGNYQSRDCKVLLQPTKDGKVYPVEASFVCWKTGSTISATTLLPVGWFNQVMS